LSDAPESLLVRNEQAKLTATYLNGLAIAIFAVGGLAPAVALVSGSAQVASSGPIALMSLSCLIASAALHFLARSVLKRLQP
jgi:hypothetical protein